MNYMVVLIVDDIEQCPAVLDAWEEEGVSGVTILRQYRVRSCSAGRTSR